MKTAKSIPDMTEIEVIEMTGIGLDTLSRLRQLRLGPSCYYYNGIPHYAFDTTIKWLNEQEAILRSLYGAFSKQLLNREMRKIAWSAARNTN